MQRVTRAAKLNWELVRDMRLDYAADTTLSYGRLGQKYGVSANQAGRIIRNEVWKDDAVAGASRVAGPSPEALKQMAAESSKRLAMKLAEELEQPTNRYAVTALGPDGLTDQERGGQFKKENESAE